MATSADVDTVPEPIEPGPEMTALARFHRDVTWIGGDRPTFETVGEGPVRLRLVWDLTDPTDLTWWNESSVGGAAWSLIEEYHLTPE